MWHLKGAILANCPLGSRDVDLESRFKALGLL